MRIADLLKNATALQPRDAITTSGIIPYLCRTDTIHEVEADGRVIPLKLKGAKFGVGYCRVSTEDQRDDGFSTAEQVNRIIDFFVQRGEAFRIYSDATLSGMLPPNDARLIQQMLAKQAKRYEANFRAVFLDGPMARRRTPQEVASMERYLERELACIRRGYGGEDSGSGTILKPKRGKALYRPALTLLLDDLPYVHTLAITDLTRLYRSSSLQVEIAEKMQADACTAKIVGLIESVDYLNALDTFGNKLQATILAAIGEQVLATNSLNALRGTMQMLEEGKPPGRLSYFLTRDKAGFPVWKPGARDSMGLLVRLVMEAAASGEPINYAGLQRAMIDAGRPSLSHKLDWARPSIIKLLRSKALCGIHEQFGLEYALVPDPVLTRDAWERLQIVLEDYRAQNARNRRKYRPPDETCYLGTGLLRCACGGSMCHHRYQNGVEAYWCTNERKRLDAPGREGPHVQLNCENTHAFLSALAKAYRPVLSPIAGNPAQYDRLREQHRHLSGRLLDAKVQLQRNQDRYRADAVAQAARIGVTKADEGFDAVISGLVARLTQGTRQDIDSLQATLDGLQREMQTYTSQQQAEALAAKIEQWEALPVRERNAILHHIFDCLYVQGSDPCCQLVPVLRGGRELPPVPILYKVRHFKSGPRYLRRLPESLDEYVRAVLDWWLGTGTEVPQHAGTSTPPSD